MRKVTAPLPCLNLGPEMLRLLAKHSKGVVFQGPVQGEARRFGVHLLQRFSGAVQAVEPGPGAGSAQFHADLGAGRLPRDGIGRARLRSDECARRMTSA